MFNDVQKTLEIFDDLCLIHQQAQERLNVAETKDQVEDAINEMIYIKEEIEETLLFIKRHCPTGMN